MMNLAFIYFSGFDKRNICPTSIPTRHVNAKLKISVTEYPCSTVIFDVQVGP